MTQPKKKKEVAVAGRAVRYEGPLPIEIDGVGVIEPGEVIPEASAVFTLVVDLPDFLLVKP